MIARTWHGVTYASKANDSKTGVAEYQKTEGNRGVYVLQRVEGDLAHFLLLTLWQSEDAIKRFAGSEMEKAKYYPEDEMFLLELEPKVMHYEVLVQPSQCKSQTDIKWLRMASRDRIISFERCCDENIASNFY